MKKILSLFAAVLFAGSMMAADLLNVDFTKGQGDWTISNVVMPEGSEFIWAAAGNYGMKATAYFENAAHASESWLISPVIDLSAAESASLAINHAMNKGNNSTLAVLASTDGEAWTSLELSAWPAGTNWTFIDATADLSAFAGKSTVQIAFKYESTLDNCPTWEIKTVVISDGDAPEPPVEGDVVFTGEDFMGQGTSNTGSLVTATKNGVTFACDKGYNDDAHATLRCYKNGVITITSETEQIGKLVFQFYQTYNGGLANEVAVNAKEWSYTLASQARIEKLTIFFGDAPEPPVVIIDTITVAKALELGAALGDGGVSEKEYVVEGYVAYIDAFFSDDFKNETFYISDDKDSRSKENAFEIYRGKPNTEAEIGLDAKVSIKCKLKNYKGTIENDGSNVPFNVVEASTFVPEEVTVEEAVEIALAVSGDNVPTPDYYIIKGYINEVTSAYTSKYNNATFTMAQFPNEAEGSLKAYQASILKADSNNVKTEGPVSEELYVNVMGYLTKYKSAAQIVKGSHVAFVDAPKTDTIHVSVAEAVAIGLGLPVEGKSDEIYAVTGFVNLVAEDFAEGIESFFMADEAESEEYNFYAASALIAEAVAEGQKVEIVGRLQNADGETIVVDHGQARILPGEGIENIQLTEKAQKVAVDGQLFIIRDGKMFNAQGIQVR